MLGVVGHDCAVLDPHRHEDSLELLNQPAAVGQDQDAAVLLQRPVRQVSGTDRLAGAAAALDDPPLQSGPAAFGCPVDDILLVRTKFRRGHVISWCMS